MSESPTKFGTAIKGQKKNPLQDKSGGMNGSPMKNQQADNDKSPTKKKITFADEEE